MIEQIIDLIQTHTSIIDGKPAGLTHKYLNKIYDSLISKMEYPNSVPTLGQLLSPHFDIIIKSAHNSRGDFIIYHMETYDKLKKELQKEVANV